MKCTCFVILGLQLLFLVGYVKYQASLRRVCYYTNWAQYRNGPGKFYPENVDPSLCTHIIYAFAKMVGNHLAAFEWNDESTPWMKGMYARFHGIKQQNPSVKLLLAVGGWNMGSAPFTRMVASDANRRDFAKTSAAFLRKHNFDGIDMDWEYPANRGSPSGDRHKFTDLLQTLHDEFQRESMQTGKQRLLITAAVAAGKDKIDTAYDIPEISRYLDFINLMTYDLHGSWEDHTGHNSPLYARSSETGNDTFLNLNWAAQYWASKGAPRDKLNIGLALYGRTFKLPYSHTSDMIGCPAAGAGPAGQYTREAGFMAYYEICLKLAAGATKRYEAEQKVPYLVQNEIWVGYDDPDSLKIKVDYIKHENFGGIMVWALDLDDFSGMCGQGKYPLMKAIVNALNSAGGSSGGGSPGGGLPGGGFPSGPINFIPTPTPTTTTTQRPTTTTTQRTTHALIFPGFTFPTYTNRPVTTKAPIITTPTTTTTTTKPTTTTTTTPAPTTTKPTTTKPTTIKPTTPTTTTDATTTVPGISGIFHQLTAVSRNEFDCVTNNDGYYPSPTSCTEYFVCAAGITFKTDCHPGLLFNTISLYCDFPDHVTCKAGHLPTQTTHAPVVTHAPIVTHAPWAPWVPPSTTPPPPTTKTTKAPVTVQYNGNPADFCKGKPDGFYKDPLSCTHFYSCSYEVSYHEPCPAQTFFSETLQGCDWAMNVPNCP